jgi:hypothetical protein
MEPSDPSQQQISKSSNTDVDPSHILQSSWIRCLVCINNQIDWILCGNRHCFLLHFNILFFVVLCIMQKQVTRHDDVPG